MLGQRRFARTPASIRSIILLLLFTIFVPVLLLQAGIYYTQFQARQTEELQSNLEVARAVAASFDMYVASIFRQEDVLADQAVSSTKLAQITRELALAVRVHHTVRRFNWVNPQGIVLASSSPGTVGRDLRHRAYFQAIQAGQPRVVSDLFIGMTDNQPSFAIVTAKRDSHGRLLGVVVGVIKPGDLDDFLDIRRINNGTINICDGQGRTVYRHPNTKPIVWNPKARKTPMVVRVLAGEEVSTVMPTPGTTDNRMGSAVPIRSIGWGVAATRPTGQVLAPIREKLWQAFLLLLTVIVATILVAWHIVLTIARPVHCLHEHALAIADGVLDQQITVDGPRELRDLASAFNQMAHALKEREEEREVYLHCISHDLANPLTAIQGHTEHIGLVLEEAHPGHPLQASVQRVLTGTRHRRDVARLAQPGRAGTSSIRA